MLNFIKRKQVISKPVHWECIKSKEKGLIEKYFPLAPSVRKTNKLKGFKKKVSIDFVPAFCFFQLLKTLNSNKINTYRGFCADEGTRTPTPRGTRS